MFLLRYTAICACGGRGDWRFGNCRREVAMQDIGERCVSWVGLDNLENRGCSGECTMVPRVCLV